MTKGTARAISTASHFTSVFLTTIICMIAAVFILSFIFNIKMFAVQSGSMTPKYPVGSVVCVKEVEFSDLVLDDVITFVANDDGTLVTHRVIGIDTERQQVITKGDANTSQDANPVASGNIVGKVIFGIPLLGSLLSFITDSSNRIVVFGILIGFGILSYILDRIDKKCLAEEKRKEDEENARTEDGQNQKLSDINGTDLHHMHSANHRNKRIPAVYQRNPGKRVRTRSNSNMHGRSEGRRQRRGS